MNTSILPGTYNSGGCTGVTDMNNDGLDDIIILDESIQLSIAYQQANGSFSVSYIGAVSNTSQWGMCVGDIDNDGHKDIMCGGAYDNVHIVNIDGPGQFTIVDYPWASIFTQGCNLADIDADGFLDGFLCHDDGHNMILHNTGAGDFTDGQNMIDMVFYPEINGNDNSGNYGSVWTDFDRDGDTDLFIAKCRQFISDPLDPRRTNVLVVNNGDGTYDHTNPATAISYAQERGLVNLEQSWTSDFADIDNDGDFDCFLTTHSNTLEIYENDGNGYFTDRTQGSGLQYSGFFLQGKLHDFDNDGFVDLIHSGGNHDYYHNNGNFTFTRIQNMFVNNDVMHSFGIGDLNHDGYLDVYASYGDGYVNADNAHPDRIFINNGGTNNWIAFDLLGIVSNIDAVGAIVEITGAFGTQVREIRAGESYGITNTATCHFGIGTFTAIDQVNIHWPSGLVTTLTNPEINTFHSIPESPCQLESPVIAASGPTSFCEGGSVTLTANNNNLNYTWNNGLTGSSITVTEPGNYYATATSNEGCIAITNSIAVTNTQDPTAAILGDEYIESCSTAPVMLTASSGTSFSWSNGATSPSISVAVSGTYTVQVTSACGTATSAPVVVSIIPTPAAPTVANVSVPINTTATLVSPGNENTNWYNAENDLEPVYTGSTFTTPPLSSTTDYWVESFNTGEIVSTVGGKPERLLNAEGQFQANSTYYMLFDAFQPVIINTVKVYAQGEAERTIALIDAQGNTLASGTYLIPDGESIVTLDFMVPQGPGYGLRLVGNNPLLWRDKDSTTPFAYPFNIGDLISITGTNVTGANTYNYYYYFFDWHVSNPVTYCYSDRVQVFANTENLPPVEGCTDPIACNFDASATLDNGLCVYPGCTDNSACNYNPTAACDNGLCTYPGCIDPNACNYESFAGCDNGSCSYAGTTCNDNNPGTMLDQVNAICNCQGTPFNYGIIATTTSNLCPGVAPQAITLSAPLNLQSYAVQWYYREGANACPSGNSTAGWNILSGEVSLSYTPSEFAGTRTYACFISPSGIYGIPASWANGCRTISYTAFDAQAIIGNPNIQPFSSVTYAVNPIAGHTYNWTVANGAITSGQGTSVITILWGQSGPYQVTMTESNGICSDASSLLVVNSNCSISVSAIAEGGNSFCPGSSTTLQAVSDATGITYQWYYNGNEIPDATGASVEITSGGNYQVLITQAACTAVSQTLFITTLPAVVVPQLSINATTPGCSGGTVVISAEGGSFDSYLWNNGETTSSIEVSVSGDYSVDLADANGCHATAGPVSVNLALQEPLPICIVSVDQTTNNNIIVWEPLASEVTSSYAVYKETNIADQYVNIGTVSYGSDGLFTDLNSNASVQASRYKLALIDTCGIESFLTPQHKTIHLTSNVGLNNTVNLIWSHYEGFFFGSYNIYRGDAANNLTLLTTIASNLNSYTDLNPLVGTTFYVIEVEGISCDPTREVVFSRSNVIAITSENVVESASAQMSVFPNPTSGIMSVNLHQHTSDQSIMLTSITGERLLERIVTNTSFQLNMEEYASGIYLLQLRDKNGVIESTRIVKQ